MSIKVKEKVARAGRKRASVATQIFASVLGFSFLMMVSISAYQIWQILKLRTAENIKTAEITSGNLMDRLGRVLETTPTVEEEIRLLKERVRSVGETGIFNEIALMNPEGSQVAVYPRELAEAGPSEPDRQALKEIFSKRSQEKWRHSLVTAKRKLFLVTNIEVINYVPLYYEGKIRYVVKTRFSARDIAKLWVEVSATLAPVLAVILVLGIFLAISLARFVGRPLRTLNHATLQIAGGRLDLRVDVKTGNEIEELADTFNHMTVELVKMKERAENANPLTKLPGNNVIREEIENRIRDGKKFVVVHSDLDNFKAFNDKYGIGQGDVAIKLTADLFKEALEKAGDSEDFVGHEGGDDFVLVTTPERADRLTSYFIERFDEEIVKLYNDEDRRKGYIEAKNRQGVLCKFPLMSISLAGVGNHVRDFKSYGEITNVMPELKEKAKSQKGSVFVLDRRKEG